MQQAIKAKLYKTTCQYCNLYIKGGKIIYNRITNSVSDYKDSRGYLFKSSHRCKKLFRSTDGGKTWHSVLNVLDHVWGFDESSDGTLYAGEYCSHRDHPNENCAKIWKSDDGGDNWTIIFDKSATAKHIHDVFVSSNGWIYASVGEIRTKLNKFIIKIIKIIPNRFIKLLMSLNFMKKIMPDLSFINYGLKIYPDAGLWRNNGSSWEKIYNKTQLVPINEFNGYIYVGEEHPTFWTLRTNRILRFKDDGNPSVKPEVMFDTNAIGKMSFYWINRSKDKLVIGLSDEKILETTDGKHFYKLPQ